MLYAVDFDETLNKSSLDKVYNPNYKLISFLRDKIFFILTARDDVEYNRQYIDDFLKSNLLFPEKILFSNRELKGPMLKSEGAGMLIDDKQEQRQSAEEHGVRAIHPDDLDNILEDIGINKIATQIITDNVNSDYIGPDKLRDKSWFRTDDKSWYYWMDGDTDLKNKPLDPDDALRELINFSYKNNIETLPSYEGHVISKSEALSAFNKLKKDKEKINGEGLELINTEDKSKKIIFKNPGYDLPFNKPEDMIQEHYSGYIGLKFKSKALAEWIFEQIAKIDKSVKVDLDDDALHIYVESNSQKKQKELWKEITEIIISEVEISKKEARLKRLKTLCKEASKENFKLESPEDVYKMLVDKPNPKVYLDSPMGSRKGFGSKKRKLPFDYGEFSDWINPADDMGWDIIIPPSNREQTNLIQVGIVRVNPDETTWKEKANKKPPIGNDKIIVASNGKISDEDKGIIEDFFSGMWQFKEVEWFGGMEKEARKRRLSFFRTNLDYGERKSRLENDAKDYNAPREGKKRWSTKYKKKIDCSNPKGFSQKQYCKRKKRGGAYKE